MSGRFLRGGEIALDCERRIAKESKGSTAHLEYILRCARASRGAYSRLLIPAINSELMRRKRGD
jgi:hypothetical protein